MESLPKLSYLVPCNTAAGVVYLNPLHIVAIEPLDPSIDNKTRIRVSNALNGTESEIGGEPGSSVEVIFTTDLPEDIAARTERALHSLHHAA